MLNVLRYTISLRVLMADIRVDCMRQQHVPTPISLGALCLHPHDFAFSSLSIKKIYSVQEYKVRFAIDMKI